MLGLCTVLLAFLIDEGLILENGLIVTSVLAILTLCLFIGQTWLISRNWTNNDIEELIRRDIFAMLGVKECWLQMMGSHNPLFWFLPIGRPDVMQCLDYGASIPVKGVITSQ